MNNYQAPWEKPEIAMILSILGGKVISVNHIGYNAISKEVNNEDIR